MSITIGKPRTKKDLKMLGDEELVLSLCHNFFTLSLKGTKGLYRETEFALIELLSRLDITMSKADALAAINNYTW